MFSGDFLRQCKKTIFARLFIKAFFNQTMKQMKIILNTLFYLMIATTAFAQDSIPANDPNYQKGLAYYEKENFKGAFKWFLKSAEAGNVEAQKKLGTMYHKKQGVKGIRERIDYWYNLAIEQGDIDAKYEYASILNKRHAEDYAFTATFQAHRLDELKPKYDRLHERFINLYKSAANQGHVEANFVMGNIAKNADQPNYNEALSWYKKASDLGHSQAQYNIGEMYYKGEGITVDKEQALSWFHKAAQLNHQDAYYGLGMMYYNGQGTPTNKEEAFKWLLKATEGWNPRAKYWLGVMYFNGEGTPVNKEESAKWINKAKNQLIEAHLFWEKHNLKRYLKK